MHIRIITFCLLSVGALVCAPGCSKSDKNPLPTNTSSKSTVQDKDCKAPVNTNDNALMSMLSAFDYLKFPEGESRIAIADIPIGIGVVLLPQSTTNVQTIKEGFLKSEVLATKALTTKGEDSNTVFKESKVIRQQKAEMDDGVVRLISLRIRSSVSKAPLNGAQTTPQLNKAKALLPSINPIKLPEGTSRISLEGIPLGIGVVILPPNTTDEKAIKAGFLKSETLAAQGLVNGGDDLKSVLKNTKVITQRKSETEDGLIRLTTCRIAK